MRQEPSASAIRLIDQAITDRRARDAIDKPLGQLEHDRAQLLKAANACRQAASWLPTSRDWSSPAFPDI